MRESERERERERAERERVGFNKKHKKIYLDSQRVKLYPTD